MTFICNAGPVIALAKIDHLSLLGHLSDTVLIPVTVFHETLAKPGADADRIVQATRSFLSVMNPPEKIDENVAFATRHLDLGEKQVIALASTIPAPRTVLLDDAAGRKAADCLGYPILGFVGTLLIAKKRGLLSSIGPLLIQARDEGYWLSNSLIDTAKRLAEE